MASMPQRLGTPQEHTPSSSPQMWPSVTTSAFFLVSPVASLYLPLHRHTYACVSMHTHVVGLHLSREEEGALQNTASVIEEDITFLAVQSFYSYREGEIRTLFLCSSGRGYSPSGPISYHTPTLSSTLIPPGRTWSSSSSTTGSAPATP